MCNCYFNDLRVYLLSQFYILFDVVSKKACCPKSTIFPKRQVKNKPRFQDEFFMSFVLGSSCTWHATTSQHQNLKNQYI